MLRAFCYTDAAVTHASYMRHYREKDGLLVRGRRPEPSLLTHFHYTALHICLLITRVNDFAIEELKLSLRLQLLYMIWIFITRARAIIWLLEHLISLI